MRTEYLGRKCFYYKSIDSTQKKIKSFKEPDNGTIVIADNQTEGIGTHDRMWYTGINNNIAMSFVLIPNCPIKKMQDLTTCIAETMVSVLKRMTHLEIEIKPPNDLVVKKKKIGGILTQSSCEGEIVKRIFIGIGLNVNQEKFPGNLNKIATSLKKETRRDFDREKIIVQFLNKFEKAYKKRIR